MGRRDTAADVAQGKLLRGVEAGGAGVTMSIGGKPAMWIAIGAGIGAELGVSTESMAVGLAAGIAIGAAIGAAVATRG